MSASGSKSLPSIGFLTVVPAAEHGLLGGYLVLNAVGRPLEFHCTAPVKPNRAQEILFGPTLEPFMYGEQIGQTLLKKSKLAPDFVCTNHQAVLSVRPFIKFPVVLVDDPSSVAADTMESGRSFRVDGGHKNHQPMALKSFSLGEQNVAVAQDYESDVSPIRELWNGCSALDLAEPFERIREAVDEAQRGKRQ